MKYLIYTLIVCTIVSCGGTIGGIDMYRSCKYKKDIFHEKLKYIAATHFRSKIFEMSDTAKGDGYNYIRLYINRPKELRFTCILYLNSEDSCTNLIFTHVKIQEDKLAKIDKELSFIERWRYRKLIRDSIVTVLNNKYNLGFKHAD